MPEAMEHFRASLKWASLSIRAALADISLDEMTLHPGDGLRSFESLIGEATMALREAFVAIGCDELPEVPGGFEVRYARWGAGAGSDAALVELMIPVFTRHVEGFDRAIRALGPADLDAAVDLPGGFDEEGLFSYRTVGEVLFSVSGFIHFLAGEASTTRLALGKQSAPDPFDEIIGSGDDSSIESAGAIR